MNEDFTRWILERIMNLYIFMNWRWTCRLRAVRKGRERKFSGSSRMKGSSNRWRPPSGGMISGRNGEVLHKRIHRVVVIFCNIARMDHYKQHVLHFRIMQSRQRGVVKETFATRRSTTNTRLRYCLPKFSCFGSNKILSDIWKSVKLLYFAGHFHSKFSCHSWKEFLKAGNFLRWVHQLIPDGYHQ